MHSEKHFLKSVWFVCYFPIMKTAPEVCPGHCAMGLVQSISGYLCALGLACLGQLCGVLWLLLTTRGHCGSRTSCGSQPVLQLTPRPLRRPSLLCALRHQPCASCVKGRDEPGHTQSPVAPFPKVVSLHVPLKINRGTPAVGNHLSLLL